MVDSTLAKTPLLNPSDRQVWKSGTGGNEATVLTVKNNLQDSVRLEWMDFNAQPIPY